MLLRRILFIGLGVLLSLAVAAGLALAADPAPNDEPTGSPLFDATLQQAVDELDGKAAPRPLPPLPLPTTHYTTDPNLWKECEFGFTRDLVKWPSCHFTSDPKTHPQCATIPRWPTVDYTWDASLWEECGPDITKDVNALWCTPTWTADPKMGIQCDPKYTTDPQQWPWCNPRYTLDPALWPNACTPEVAYTYADKWPECAKEAFTTDPYRWAACHYTSDPATFPVCASPFPTQDYTSNPEIWRECPGPEYTFDAVHWPWCKPDYTLDPQQPECRTTPYTTAPQQWPWCADPLYTTEPAGWPVCHFTSDPQKWTVCQEKYPTKDYTYDAKLWPECGALTQDPAVWPWCKTDVYTHDPDAWPWCNQAWTWEPQQWSECTPGYTNDPQMWPACGKGLYTSSPDTWPECEYYTADARIWPACHYTSDPNLKDCTANPLPTKDYTTDPGLWADCERPREYTSNPQRWTECHYTSDSAQWPECKPEPELADLGDAPDSSNHAGAAMTAFPAGGPPGVGASYPTAFDPATGLPTGPKHWRPLADAWLGPAVTLENDADLLPDNDGMTNIDPVNDKPDRDVADDGVVLPVPGPHCTPTTLNYNVTVPAGAAGMPRFVNVWFDWNRDGDWQDIFQCPSGMLAYEWAVQNQALALLPPGTYPLVTPPYLPWNPPEGNIPQTWMRISIAEQPAPHSPGVGGSDGQGPANGYRHGETEDYYLSLACTKPVAGFKWDPPNVCKNDPVQFWDTSTNSPTSWSWDFGDGGTSTAQNPSHTFTTAGFHSVRLTVSNVCGTDTITQRLEVKDCPDQKDHDIYIKDNPADDGSVPSLAGLWWNSPDIWVRTDGDCSQLDHQNPIPGTDNTICVRVRNRLATTVDAIKVNIYYAAAALGLPWPGGWSYVDSFAIASLAGGATTVGSVVWHTPYLTGHFCLLARADAPKDPIGSGPDTVGDPNVTRNNNNIAQKNVNVIDYPEVKACGFYSTNVAADVVYLDAVNTWNANKQADIVFDSSDFPAGGALVIEPGTLWMRWSSLTNLNQVGHTLLPSAFPATIGGINLLPYETARMTMTITASIDERFAVSVREWVDGAEVGGISYVRDMPDCIYLPVVLKGYSP